MRSLTYIGKPLDRLNNVLIGIVGILVLSTVFLVSADVAGRYFFRRPIGWVFEVTEHIMVLIPFFGMAWLVRHGAGHVKIEILVQTLSESMQRKVNALVSILAGSVCGFAAYHACIATADHFSRGLLTFGIYPIPKFWLVAAIAFGLTLTSIEFFRKAWNIYQELRDF